MAVSTTVQVTLPAMGESVTEGTVLEWHKAEGDTVEADETLVEISTDKVDAEVPAPVTGTVVKVCAAEGDTVTVGAVLAEIQPSGNGAAPAALAEEPAAAEGGAAAAPPAPPAEGAGEIVDIVTPGAGESVTEGTLLEWHVQVGSEVADGDTVVEISTDKVDVELPAPAAGVITEVLAAEGETVTVGQVIARMRVGAGAAPAVPAAPGGNGATAAPPAPAAPAAPPEGLKVSPVAARVAAAEGVSLTQVSGTGPGGRVTKADVLAAKETGPSPAAASAQPLRGGAAMLAKYMDESRSIPTATSFRTITVTQMDGRRRQLKDAGQRVSFTHLIAYAIARAATESMPVMAHHFAEDGGRPQRIDDGAVHLGIAVDVEKKDGSRTLMVPVIRDAGRMRFSEFKAAFDALIDKARTNTLSADDLQGANITLTNPGGIGTVASVPRLMVGQGTIVATGSIAYPVGLGNVGALLGAEKVMTMTSTYDHRIIQGAESGRFLQVVEGYLQGEHGFYDEIFADLGAALGPAPEPPEPQLAAAAAAPTVPAAAVPEGDDLVLMQAVQAATSLIKAYRTNGHLAARLDPLGSEPIGDPALDPDTVHLTPELMRRIPSKILRIYVEGETLEESLPHLQETYTGTIAYEIEHISNHRQRVWLREHIESGTFRKPLDAEHQRWLLRRLIAVDALERFMHKAYLGQKQFSIEGLDMTVPMLDEAIELAARGGAREVVIGMAHRGRLNVLAHNLGRPYETIFGEFEGTSTVEVVKAVTEIPQGGTGDVKYHHGFTKEYALRGGGSTVLVNLESNPSHLEFVNPVVLGASRAAQTDRSGPRAQRDPRSAVPIVLHGDAAFPGQGIVAESLNLQGLDGYQVGGALHIVQNNQIGFTTDFEDSRSTQWASDLAKGFDVPIIHVNADDVEACIAAVDLAMAFREEFGHDVLIDLIGYRRFGHNEADEPAYTQPEMYVEIKRHERVSNLYATSLVERAVVSREEVDTWQQDIWDDLTRRHQELKAQIKEAQEAGTVEQPTGEYQLDRTQSPPVRTAVPADLLRTLNEELLTVPEGFTIHPKLVKQLERRREAVGPGGGIDWAQAEALAFASLLTEGVPLRLTGQDAERGTFSQRHMVLHDAKTGQTFAPIQHLREAQAPVELHNSPLSEAACLGFEYGYSQESPETLVLWEAQFGDFGNGAQVIIDQFIVSGLAKWGQTSRLTLLLPHGYEGSGPEHSSARLERFLQLAAEGNIRVANLTTPAQYFHLLRRQALIGKQRPLVIMTPKSLLRLPQATNRIEHLSDTQFFPVLGEPRVPVEKVRRLLLCTGKIYYDLVGHAKREGNDAVAIGRVELLYPFPEHDIRALIATYPNLKEVLWVQEEPRNMGARAHMFPRLMQILPQELEFGFVGRPERASPGEGYPAAHNAEQNRILATALDPAIAVSAYPKKLPGER
ncbi:MAG TPA: multifunctional oxoglutarate decarboxylase/oxoglutarate dehydrogenase thiamine pyrophosphate-binding subunit/dihydrolipoyllysine-residue succinyltransferase subunit [Solirubrobacteraceae bacterium]|nr:multifunctional oxoglutarate decarboxylase/oxoglutarate dehydrogenase thiamine pyrophosphate-binding subunit/dihydrolipoyllysine-residue succinyltransferase subunit [Solirubrobacteraceae bacterium]